MSVDLRFELPIEPGDAVILLGLALIVMGVGLWSVPAGCIAAGLSCVGIGRALLQGPPPESGAPGDQAGEDEAAAA
jgi:hypothetical protein